MKKNTFFLIATLIICSNNLFGQTDNNKFDPLLNKVKNWFNAWDLVYKNDYALFGIVSPIINFIVKRFG
jgi:hypothetical protein